MNGEVGSKSNNESFQSVLKAMGECSDGQEKLHLLDQMTSLSPRSTKRMLIQNNRGLAFFDGLFTPDGQPGEVLGTVGKFGSYLEEKGIDKIQFKESIESIYGNLKLSHLSNSVYGGERKRLNFSQSNFAKCPERIGKLEAIAYHNSSAYWREDCKDNLEMIAQGIFVDTLKNNGLGSKKRTRCGYFSPNDHRQSTTRCCTYFYGPFHGRNACPCHGSEVQLCFRRV